MPGQLRRTGASTSSTFSGGTDPNDNPSNNHTPHMYNSNTNGSEESITTDEAADFLDQVQALVDALDFLDDTLSAVAVRGQQPHTGNDEDQEDQEQRQDPRETTHETMDGLRMALSALQSPIAPRVRPVSVAHGAVSDLGFDLDNDDGEQEEQEEEEEAMLADMLASIQRVRRATEPPPTSSPSSSGSRPSRPPVATRTMAVASGAHRGGAWHAVSHRGEDDNIDEPSRHRIHVRSPAVSPRHGYGASGGPPMPPRRASSGTLGTMDLLPVSTGDDDNAVTPSGATSVRSTSDADMLPAQGITATGELPVTPVHRIVAGPLSAAARARQTSECSWGDLEEAVTGGGGEAAARARAAMHVTAPSIHNHRASSSYSTWAGIAARYGIPITAAGAATAGATGDDSDDEEEDDDDDENSQESGEDGGEGRRTRPVSRIGHYWTPGSTTGTVATGGTETAGGATRHAVSPPPQRRRTDGVNGSNGRAKSPSRSWMRMMTGEVNSMAKMACGPVPVPNRVGAVAVGAVVRGRGGVALASAAFV